MRYSRFRLASRLSGTFTSRAIALLVVLMHASRAHAAGEKPTPLDTRQVQAIVDQYRHELAIPQRVTVSLVEHNPLVASVERHPAKRNAFVLSLERGFAEGLNADELAAVLAHELGHVWIFTHFPYLQTESQANQVAMRVVKRERLEQVYVKVWARVGGTSTVAQFMTPASPAPTPVQAIAPRTSAVEPARTTTATPAPAPVRK